MDVSLKIKATGFLECSKDTSFLSYQLYSADACYTETALCFLKTSKYKTSLNSSPQFMCYMLMVHILSVKNPYESQDLRTKEEGPATKTGHVDSVNL